METQLRERFEALIVDAVECPNKHTLHDAQIERYVKAAMPKLLVAAESIYQLGEKSLAEKIQSEIDTNGLSYSKIMDILNQKP